MFGIMKFTDCHHCPCVIRDSDSKAITKSINLDDMIWRMHDADGGLSYVESRFALDLTGGKFYGSYPHKEGCGNMAVNIAASSEFTNNMRKYTDNLLEEHNICRTLMKYRGPSSVQYVFFGELCVPCFVVSDSSAFMVIKTLGFSEQTDFGVTVIYYKLLREVVLTKGQQLIKQDYPNVPTFNVQVQLLSEKCGGKTLAGIFDNTTKFGDFSNNELNIWRLMSPYQIEARTVGLTHTTSDIYIAQFENAGTHLMRKLDNVFPDQYVFVDNKQNVFTEVLDPLGLCSYVLDAENALSQVRVVIIDDRHGRGKKLGAPLDFDRLVSLVIENKKSSSDVPLDLKRDIAVLTSLTEREPNATVVKNENATVVKNENEIIQ